MTFRYQASLPKLPVPSLENTFSVYLQSVKPYFETENEFKLFKEKIDLFVKSEEAKKLQNLLLEKSKYSKTHWLEDWWDNLQYFEPRDPIAFNANYYFHLDRFSPVSEVSLDEHGVSEIQVDRAAFLIRAATEYHLRIQKEILEPDMENEKTPLDMTSYLWMFGACRIPDEKRDYLKKYGGSRHVVILRRGNYYVFDVIQIGGSVLSVAEIKSQLRKVVIHCNEFQIVQPPLCAFTADNRTTWFKFRQKFISSSPINENSLEQIQSALFMICLDTSKPYTKDEITWASWVGNGTTHFFDKSIEIFVFENGAVGLNGEHSKLDGFPTKRLCDFMFDFKESSSITSQVPKHQATLFLQLPVQLNFKFDNTLVDEINASFQRFQDLAKTFQMKALEWKNYGSSFIKQNKLSPDAFVQMVLQLAVYKVYGKIFATYESASTKRFLCGRTETGRSVSISSKNWIKGMTNPNLSKAEKLNLFKEACDSHSNYMRNAVRAKGCDRHMFGLRMIAEENKFPVPSFVDDIYWKSSYWQLSTSQLPSPHEGFSVGFGPVVEDGLGVCYTIRSQSIIFSISSRNHPTVNVYNFHEGLKSSLEEVYQLCQTSKL